MESVYFNLVNAGVREIGNIPEKFRQAVQNMLDKAKNNEESN